MKSATFKKSWQKLARIKFAGFQGDVMDLNYARKKLIQNIGITYLIILATEIFIRLFLLPDIVITFVKLAVTIQIMACGMSLLFIMIGVKHGKFD